MKKIILKTETKKLSACDHNDCVVCSDNSNGSCKVCTDLLSDEQLVELSCNWIDTEARCNVIYRSLFENLSSDRNVIDFDILVDDLSLLSNVIERQSRNSATISANLVYRYQNIIHVQ